MIPSPPRTLIAVATYNERENLGPLVHQIRATVPDADVLTRMIYLEFKLRLAELLLMRVDKISMSTSVEARVPFLDHRVVEFAAALPSRFWLIRHPVGSSKQVLTPGPIRLGSESLGAPAQKPSGLARRFDH